MRRITIEVIISDYNQEAWEYRNEIGPDPPTIGALLVTSVRDDLDQFIPDNCPGWIQRDVKLTLTVDEILHHEQGASP